VTDLPPALQRLLDRLYPRVDMLSDDLETGTLEPTAWRDRMAAVLAQGHTAAYMTGQGSSDLAAADQRRLMQDLQTQLGFLDNFTVEIQAAPDFQKGWNARARMYADATGMSFWHGRFRMWALPAVPRDGSSTCGPRCSCQWQIEELEGEGNALATWKLGPADHCQICVERSQQWNPLVFKNGELQ
jgi:hypothetical protein